MADEISVAVVGTGYFGRFHAEHYARNKRAKLVAVVDTNEERARAVAAEFGAEPAFDYRSILGKVDAASVAVPTPLHYEIARDLIQSGIHVLVEKPIADSVGSANALTSLAEQRKVVLQGRAHRALLERLPHACQGDLQAALFRELPHLAVEEPRCRGRRDPRSHDSRHRHDHRARGLAGKQGGRRRHACARAAGSILPMRASTSSLAASPTSPRAG
jgi:hypothetical protein